MDGKIKITEQFFPLPEKENPLKQKNISLLVSSVILGILCDYLFYEKTLGISYPIFIMVFYGFFLYNSRELLCYKSIFGWSLTLPILLLSLTYMLFSNEVFKTLNFLGIPILIIAQTTLITKSERTKWFKTSFITDILIGMFGRTFSNVFKPLAIIKDLACIKSFAKRYSVLFRIFMGVFISSILLLVIIPLLASADQVFGNWISNIPELLQGINLGDVILQFIFTLIVSVILFSYMYSFFKPRIINNRNVNDPTSIKKESGFLDAVTTITVLFCINIIYVAFTVFQFAYLFGKIVPSNFTFAEYARRGFFELIVITLINLGILLFTIYLTKASGKKLTIITQFLNTVLIFCTFIMLISSFYRMWMYEEAYGYTYLRILTHSFMVFISVILMITMCRIWSKRILLMKGYIITALVAYVILNYINIDVMIAQNNIERYKNSGNIDISYLSQLSYDVVPLMTPLMNDNKVSVNVRNGLYEMSLLLDKEKHWQSFNISNANAMKELSNLDLKYKPK